MKKILLIDTIVEDKSLSQIRHIREILGGRFDDFNFVEIHPATDGASLEKFADAQAVIFSGGIAAVYDEISWKKDLHLIVEQVLKADLPALANCFGAQFLAYHLGAKVVKNPRGREFGPIKVRLTTAGAAHPLLSHYRDKHVFATHGDIVETLPAGATLLAYNDNTPIQAYQYGRILATQFHSDIPQSTARHLLDKRKDKYLESGLLKDEKHYQEMCGELVLTNESHQLMRDFLNGLGVEKVSVGERTFTCPGG